MRLTRQQALLMILALPAFGRQRLSLTPKPPPLEVDLDSLRGGVDVLYRGGKMRVEADEIWTALQGIPMVN